MAAEIESEVEGAEVELIASGGGVFEVVAEGETLHSKKSTGEFPEPDAVIAALKSR
ncbi:MAG: Rdx family protein [Gemmatimonadetes bacterium]|nr:Rdx family protein [Gemmatimonadota bacterium]